MKHVLNTAGRPRKNNKRVCISIDASLNDRVSKRAFKENKGKSAFIADACRYYLRAIQEKPKGALWICSQSNL